MKMKQQQLRAIHHLETVVAIIQQLAEQEQQSGFNPTRKRVIEALFRLIVEDAAKLGLDSTHLTMLSKPDECGEYMTTCGWLIEYIEQIKQRYSVE